MPREARNCRRPPVAVIPHSVCELELPISPYGARIIHLSVQKQTGGGFDTARIAQGKKLVYIFCQSHQSLVLSSVGRDPLVWSASANREVWPFLHVDNS
ncbi:hypothetical protein J6590_002217 [Homalodisca vitripennis]|nr:hypothetical protein J6590_002217 [Homalodisca vitripennis]